MVCDDCGWCFNRDCETCQKRLAEQDEGPQFLWPPYPKGEEES